MIFFAWVIKKQLVKNTRIFHYNPNKNLPKILMLNILTPDILEKQYPVI
jgi:hypothetical protein